MPGGRGKGSGERKGGGGQLGKKNNNRSSNQLKNARTTPQFDSTKRRKQILLLHGNRQTGQLLLGRMEKLKKALSRELGLDIVAPDSPHLFLDGDGFGNAAAAADQDGTGWQRMWWQRKDNTYIGMEESIFLLDELWNRDDQEFVAIIGFSQGSRLAHFISLLHTITNGVAFPGLKCVVHVSGYGDRPRPDNFCSLLVNDGWKRSIPSYILEKMNDEDYNFVDIQINQPSLHVMGEADKLIPLKSSEALLKWYVQPSVYVHPGSHFVPVKKHDIEKYIDFFRCGTGETNLPSQPLDVATDGSQAAPKAAINVSNTKTIIEPDEEHAQAQIDEVFSIAQIFPSEFCLLSKSTPRDPETYDPDDYFEENRIYEHPIKYSILLQPQDNTEQSEEQLWPPKSISLSIQYPTEYPDISPTVSLIHDMNYMQFSMKASDALLGVVRKSMKDELGNPCIMSLVYAARDFFEGGQLASFVNANSAPLPVESNEDTFEKKEQSLPTTSTLILSDAARIKECTAQGLRVACDLLSRAQRGENREVAATDETIAAGKCGTWRFTVGLVGKPSAGKSTFFNAATAFARQRGEGGGEVRCEHKDATGGDGGIIVGGASMAPHPFTTIDPNIGYCLVPAPVGACPEDDEKLGQSGLALGSSHGRDVIGRRFIPVCLKDVAGLVPGAYQGRGRGNKFLDDLTDADVLIHIVDASGSSDAEGNKLCNDENLDDDLKNPIHDLEWIRNELVEWVYFNISSKWDGIVRRGKEKLIGMFSGYKQSQSFTYDVLAAVDKFVEEMEGHDRIRKLETWDEADLRRLVSAFLGARFPMALALNKADISSSAQYISDIQSKLPIYGHHVGVSLSAHEEMKFIRHQITQVIKSSSGGPFPPQPKSTTYTMSGRVWDCLQSALSLRRPVLVFPVIDMETLEPLPGLTNGYATRDSSLPNHNFISCITAAGGTPPSQWDNHRKMYTPGTKGVKHALRDVILLKPGSTIEDVFLALKGKGALEGEFVRAEGLSKIGDKPKPVMKSELVGKHNRILKIMTTKRRVEWQKRRVAL